MTKEDDRPSARRTFFREAMAQALRPLAAYIEPHVKRAPSAVYLRPPGAIEELAFLRECTRCGTCASTCPADAISLLPDETGEAAGTPVIDPEFAPCRLCDGLRCTEECPTGALIRLASPEMVHMGTAEVYGPTCRRSIGEACTACVDICPFGEKAIRITGNGGPEVITSGCVGCGLCQHACPTMPKAIYVVAHTQR